jgi:hypothetical protein
MFSDKSTITVLPDQAAFLANACGSLEKCLDSIEGLNAMLHLWCISQRSDTDDFSNPVSIDKNARWAIYTVTGMIRDITVIAQQMEH